MTKTYKMNKGWLFARENESFAEVTLPHHAFTEPEVIEVPSRELCTYKLKIFGKPEWRGKIILFHVGAAMQKTKVFVNDKYIFTHFGGYQRFVITLTDILVFGEDNTIRLELDNCPIDDMPPGKPMNRLDFCYHGGLHREAYLTVTDAVHISDELAVSIPGGGGVFIKTESIENGTAKISANCHVMNEMAQSARFDYLGKPVDKRPISVKMTIADDTGKILAQNTSESLLLHNNCDFNFHVDAEIPDAPLWSPETPHICTARFDVILDGEILDSRTEKFGIRTICFKRDGFYLNGNKCFLLGTNRHSEFPFIGNAAPANAQKRDALLIKSAGCNFIRLSHYVQDMSFIEACDEAGIMLMAAIPGWQYYGQNEHFYNNAFRDCRELIRTHRNHPSVILWEVSLNESYPPNWINAEFHRIAHEEYPGDQCYTCGDTIGNFEGWDVLFFHDKLENREKPIIIREYGDWAFGGNASTSRRARGDGNKELLGMAWNFQWTLNRALVHEGVVATADWCFIDYNRGCAPDIERSGTVDIFRLPKPKFYLYRSQNCDEPMVAPFRSGEKIVVFSNCEEVKLEFADGTSLTAKPDSGPDSPYSPNAKTSPGWETAQLWYADSSGGNPYDGGNCIHLPHPPFTFNGVGEGDVKVSGLIGGKTVCTGDVKEPGEAKSVQTRIRTYGVPLVKNDVVFADAILTDAAGTVVPSNNVAVKFTVSGGKVIDSQKSFEAGIASCLIRVEDPDKLEIKAQ